MIPMTLVPAVVVWQTPPLDMWVWLIFIGVIGTLGQIVVTDAFKLADMTVLMPLDFLKLVWATAFGIVLFAGVPDFLFSRRMRSYSAARSTSPGGKSKLRRAKALPT